MFFAATGITDGELLRGVRYWGDGASTQSLVMRSKSGTIRIIDGNAPLDEADVVLRRQLRVTPENPIIRREYSGPVSDSVSRRSLV